ncbi:FRAS1- extracellular matrix protein 1, partial [Clonorchis sinensis]
MQTIFSCLIIVTLCMPKCFGIPSVRMPQDVMLNDAPSTPGYSLLRNDITRQNLRVVRGLSSPLLHVHLPIQMRAQKGQVCRVEVEECQPLLSMVGHLEPKKFDCSFADGDVVYYHGGNPLTNHDHVQVTIFFFRDNNSVVQTVDIMVDVADESTYTGTTAWMAREDRSGVPIGNDPKFMENFSERIQVLDQLNVSSLKATSNSIGPDVLRIFYDREKEVCRLSFTSPDYGMEDEETIYSNAGLHAPKLGQPLAAGSAVGGVHRWPLFGQIVAFNRSTIYAFHHDCQEALLQGYRYMHRKANSPETDFVPIVVTIWRRQEDGSKLLLIRRGIFLRVFIANGLQLIMPVVRTFRQVNVTHIGGSLSVLPRDSLSVPHDAVPGMEFLDVNMTRMQGPLQAQIVNLRDPTRPVTSFRMNDLRGGLVALQLLNYAEALVKVFVITLTVVDPFFQISKPVNLKIATFLQPVVQMDMTSGPYLQRTPSFQVFSLPLFTYTGAVSLVHKHNIQVVGYIDESVITYTVQSWRPNFDGRIGSENKGLVGSLRLDGRFAEGLVFGPPHIVAMRLTYAHTGGYTPTIERVPLSVGVPGLTRHFRTARVRRSLVPLRAPPHQTGKNTIHDDYLGSLSVRRERNAFMTRRSRRRRRKNEDSSPELQLELSIRIVRLYNRIPDGALKSGATYRLAGSSYLCFTAEDLLTAEALQAVRSDLVNLAFTVKVTPSLGVLTYRSVITKLGKHRPPHDAFGSATDAVTRSDAELAFAQEQHILEQFQVSEITVHELEAGDICYINQRRDRITDLIGLRQTGRHDFPTVYMNLELLPPSRIVLSERMDPNVFMRARETAPHVVITPLHLNHILQFADAYNGYASNNLTEESLAPDNVVYQITGPPRFAATDTSVGGVEATHEAGRLVSLSAVTASTHEGDMNLQPGLSTSLREAEAPSVTEFTQKQINDGDIVYVPPVSDIGIMDKFVIVYYTVTGPGNVCLPDRQLRVLIVAEDNQAPKIEVLHPLDVARDGELLLNSDLISISDVDTASDRLSVHFERLPRYGDISLLMKDPRNLNSTYPVSLTEGQRLSVSMFEAGQL